MANENMDMKRMQEEAIHRVQEMQSRANRQLHGMPPIPPPPDRADSRPPSSEKTPVPPAREPVNTADTQGGPLHNQNTEAPPRAVSVPAVPQKMAENLLDGIMKDSERTLIMILLLVLFNEQADTSVIFALLYLLL